MSAHHIVGVIRIGEAQKMSVGILFGKRTWVGFSIAIGILVVMLLLGALLIVQGLLPMRAVSPWLWASYGLAAFAGGRVAARGQGRKICAFLPGTTVYALAWLLALCSECAIDFAANGLGITIAVAVGMLVAFMGGKGKRKSSRSRKLKRPSTRTLRR